MLKQTVRVLLIAAATLIVGLQLYAQETDLVTRWAESVTPENVHPEYPRPQMVRSDWINLNGLWQYAITDMDASQPDNYDGDILVPFPIESHLSGVQQRVGDQALWYHHTIDLPADWADQRVLLHFGAVDWETQVWVNGTAVGDHRGGYDAFSFDITNALTESGAQEILLRVTDPTDAGAQPRGKQIRNPESIWYTPTTGIWQTVWLEPVAEAYIGELNLVPDIDNSTLTITADIIGDGDYTIMAEAFDQGSRVATASGSAHDSVVLTLDAPKLWSPDTPFLYDLNVQLMQNDTAVDTVGSYFGMRKIALGRDSSGVLRLFLNNEPLFQFGLLDQGFWPDGLYTAPTDEALRYDIEATKQLGFNTIRKHVKVEPQRWYYWADQLGVLVWQDMPSGFLTGEASESTHTAASTAQFEAELQRMVDALDNHPSIVMWVPFNEGWGQYDTERVTAWVQELDPTRLVNNASGWTDAGVGDVLDIHSYPGPGAPQPDPNRASVLGEFGGLGLPLADHTWQDEANWGYQQFSDAGTMLDAYAELIADLRGLIEQQGLAAAIYTQTTDVEIEVNGMMTYDREIIKMGADAVRDINQIAYAPLPVINRLVPSSEFEGVQWRYTTDAPDETWMSSTFDDSGWAEGPGGFGAAQSPVDMVRTDWTEPQIWLRHEFTLDNLDFDQLYLRVHHVEDVAIFLNGEQISALPLSTPGYVNVALPDRILDLLQTGENVLAVHARQPFFAPPPQGPVTQYIDVGFYAVNAPE
ncbi:MAG: glycoside hydrolase family 2 [Anaerolineaceae bacterium]|nr:glycoside hydrolase family 2 [Anaerolineaceae bacterium]